MSDDAERWVTYAEAGQLLGISSEAARQMARRRKWQRRTPNEPGAPAMLLMPMNPLPVRHRTPLGTASDAPRYGIERDQTPEHEHPSTNGHDQPDGADLVRRTVELMMGPIREQLEHERARADRADKRADDAQAAERVARDEAAGLRTRLDQLQARGLWARLRNKR